MRVIVTGSRKWVNEEAVFDSLTKAYLDQGPFVLVHGACATGADLFAHRWQAAAGGRLGCVEVAYHAEWDKHGRAAGPIRNKAMVAAGADLVLAFPLPTGSGTQHTIQLAREAGIETKVWGEDV